jgi:proteasome lid subunit RPN8/RPN11
MSATYLPGVTTLTRARIVGRLELDASTYDGLIAHAASDIPYEVCGFLAGPDARIARTYRVPNAARSMRHYNMDPEAMLRAMNDMDERDWEIVGIYHSHTHTEAYPSATDVELAAYPDVCYVIVSLQDPEAPVIRAFDIRDGAVTERTVLRDGEEVPTGPR